MRVFLLELKFHGMDEPIEREDLITPCERTSLSSDTLQTATKEKDRLVNPA